MLRVLKIIGLMGLGGVLTLAVFFLTGGTLVWRTDYLPPAVDIDGDGETGAEPGIFGRRAGRLQPYGSEYVASTAPADVHAHLTARRALVSGMAPAQADTLALAGHRIVDGKGAVIGYRYAWGLDEPGQYPPEAGFEKLTIFLASPFAAESGSVDLGANDSAFAFWSSGPANPPWSNACIAYADEGRIEYRRTGDHYEMNLTLDLRPVHAGTGRIEDCEPVRIDQQISAWIGEYEYLDAWRGGGWGRVTMHEAVPESSF